MRLRVFNGAQYLVVGSLLLVSATALARDGAIAVSKTRRYVQDRASTTSDEDVATCNAEKVRLQGGMTAVFRDFQIATVPRSVDTLVSVDRRIRALLDARPSNR